MTAQEAYILARAYTKAAIEGAGSLKGAACQIQSIEAITGGHRVTFEWEDNDGVSYTDTMDVMDGADGSDGVGISSITYKETDVSGNYVYTVTLTDANTYDITCPKGPQGTTGATGNGIVSIEKTGTSGNVDTYTITYTNGQSTTFTVTNGVTPTVDSAMSDSSENPVQNKVITAALATKQDATDNNLTTTSKQVVGAVNELNSNLTGLNTEIEELQAYTGYGSSDIIGVEVDYVNKSFRRLGAAVGKNGGSDFDEFPMFGGRRRCNVSDDGTITKYYGETGYAEDGTNGQVMVYQPKFYYKVVPLKLEKQSTGKGYHIRKAAYYVTATPLKGFKVHPAFVDASGKELDYILIGASKGCIYDVSESAYITDDSQVMDNSADKFSSIFGVKPASGLTQDLTRLKIEQMCQNRGANWHELNVQMVAMTELLMLIEYGKFDMQRAVGKGVVDITDNSSYNCAATSGSTSTLGNASGRATSTTIVTNTSTTYTDDGKTSVTYRGEEDPYGDMWEFVMGMNVWGNGSMNGGEPYICSDYNYVESKNDGNYKGAGFTLANSDGYVNAWGYGSDDFDWLFMASEVGGSDALPVGDYFWKTTNLNGYRIALLGAYWYNSWKAGAFGWNVDNGVGNRFRHIGGRLAYLPS